MLAIIRKKVSPSDVIRVGLIGCKGQGWANITSLLKMSEVQCVVICDIDQNVLQQRKTELQKINNNPTLYTDYRKLFDNNDINVVVVATPDHWHCLQWQMRCRPASMCFWENQSPTLSMKRSDGGRRSTL